MKHTKIFTAFLLLTAMLLTFGTAVFGPSEAGANERLTPAPSLTDRDGSINLHFPGDCAAWVNDHFFLRQQLISVGNWINARLLGSTGKVIAGKDDWLYYGSTLKDYTDTVPFSDREIWIMAENLKLMQEFCESQGSRFAFTIAPNKNSLYGEHMPGRFRSGTLRNADRLVQALAEQQVAYIDLFSAFESQPDTLYFAHDSHWNSRGAALGADTINTFLGVSTRFSEGDFSEVRPHQGDLYEMLFPAFQDRETDPVYGGALDFSYTGKATKPDSITLMTGSSAEGSLLCYRDSFGNLLYPYLASSYGDCFFSRSTTYDLTQKADYVIIELVERNLAYLLENTPVFPAPVRKTPAAESAGSLVLDSEAVGSPEGLQFVSGVLPDTPDADSPVCILCGDGSFEATCGKDNSFAAYLPENVQVQAVACRIGGKWIKFTVK